MSSQKTGREMAEDLARHLQQPGGWMVWTNMPLGSVMFSNPGIADVVAISKSYTNTTVRIYEIKRSRGDFWNDVNQGKYQRYLGTCHQLYFAAESGLLKKEEVPQGCGLITHSEKGWHVQMAARRNGCEISTEFLLALLMRGSQDFWEKMRPFKTDEEWYIYKGLSDAAAKYGKDYAFELARSQDYLMEAEELRKKVNEAIGWEHEGLPRAIWGLRAEIDRLLVQYKYSEEVVKLTDILMRIFQGNSYHVIEGLREIIEGLEKHDQKVK